MSEPIPGVHHPPISQTTRIRAAATAVLVRELGDLTRTIYWVRRADTVGFSAGFYAFPGGKLEPADKQLPVAGGPPGDEAWRGAALRELFEETGLLLVRAVGPPLDRARRQALRRELLAGASFGDLLRRERLVLDGGRLLDAGRWLTPPYMPVRFDTRFFVVLLSEGADLEVLPGSELSSGEWVDPREALARWSTGSALLHPPTHHVLATFAGNPTEGAVPRLRRPPFLGGEYVAKRLEFQRGILVVPMRTPTLPPATHTNAYVLGTGDLAIVDPGSPWPEEQESLLDLLGELKDEGRTPRMVLLTHHHSDHTGAALEIARRLSLPVLASEPTAARVPGAVGRLRDGDVVDLGGPLPMRFHVLLTEGHARGHLCFLEERSRALIAGDMVASHSTIVIDPPEGDLATYLESLARLEAIPVGTLYPAHGVPIPAGPAKLREYREHREHRLVQIGEALAAGERELGGIVARVYTQIPREVRPVAERSVLASLHELARRGLAERLPGGGWRAIREAVEEAAGG